MHSRATTILARCLALLAALTGAAGCSWGQHAAAAGCGQYWRAAADEYVIENNNFLGKPECLARIGTRGFRVTRSGAAGPRGTGKPAAYPEIFTGYHWGTQAGDAFPARLSSLSYARSSWAVSTDRTPAGSAFNVAYDLWVNKHEQVAANGQPDGAEVMIWLARRTHFSAKPDFRAKPEELQHLPPHAAKHDTVTSAARGAATAVGN